MAQGDVTIFNATPDVIAKANWNLSTDTFNLGIVSVIPTQADAAPHWGGTGTTNLATNQIATATSYTGPITLTTVYSSATAGQARLTFTVSGSEIITIAQDAGGATNCQAFVIYNNTDASKRAFGFGDLRAGGTTDLSLVADPIVITLPTDYLHRLTV